MTFLLILAAAVTAVLTEAWTLMITIGVVHGEWLHTLPTIGYGSAVVVTLALTLLTGVSAAVVGATQGLIDQ